jgi:hypothetical protein
MMHAEELKALLHASPFKPFTVHLAGDKAFFVPHEDFALLTPKGRTLVISHREKEAVDLLDVALISRIEIHEPTASGS